MEELFQTWLENQVDPYLDKWLENPKNFTGWTHNYFCDDDGNPLIFKEDVPNEQECSFCHRIYQEDKKNHAWASRNREFTLKRGTFAASLYQATKDEKYLDEVKKVLFFFADYLKEMPIHFHDTVVDFFPYEKARQERLQNMVESTDFSKMPKGLAVPGPGRMLAQGLDDAVATIQCMEMYLLCEEEFSEDEKNQLNEKFFKPQLHLLENQQFIIHNITVWREAAIQGLHLVLEDGEFDLDRPLGIHHNLALGLTKEGWWSEGSFHYHFYTLEAFVQLAYLMHFFKREDEKLKENIFAMLRFPLNCAFPNHTLPNPNDGWPNISLQTYAFVYQIAALAYPDSKFLGMVEKVNQGFKTPVESFETRFFAYQEKIQTENLKNIDLTQHFTHDSKVAILKNNQHQVFVKYGINSPSHTHQDAFQYELYFANHHLVKDLSNSGYGSPINEKWYKTSLSHNTVLLDQQLENNLWYHAMVTEEMEKTFAIESSDVFQNKGILARKFTLLEDSFTLQTEVSEIKENQLVTQIQHLDIQKESLVWPEDFKPLAESQWENYHLDKDFVKKSGVGSPRKEWTFEIVVDKKIIQIKIIAKENFTPYLLQTIGNPSGENRYTIFLEGIGSLATDITIREKWRLSNANFI